MDEPTLDIKAFVGLLRRRILLILTTTVVVVGIATLVTFALKPAYTATALVLVDTSKKDVLDPNSQSVGSSTDSARVDSEVEMVRSEATLLRVIDQRDLINDPDFGYHEGWRDRLLDFLKIRPIAEPGDASQRKLILGQLEDAVRVQRKGLTYIIAVDARSTSPDTAARIANAVTDAYINQQLAAKVASIQNARDVVNGRLPEAFATLIATQGDMVNFFARKVAPIIATSGDQNLVSLANQLTATNAEGQRLSEIADVVAAGSTKADWDRVASSLESGNRSTLKADVVAQLNQQRKSLAQSLAGAKDATTQVNLRQELEKITDQLQVEANSRVTVLRQLAQQAATRASDVVDQISPELTSINLPADVNASMVTLLATHANAKNKYGVMLARENDLDTNAYLQLADSRVVSPATPPSDPSFPNTRLILGLATIAALGMGVGLAFLYENYIGGFVSEQQLEAVLGAPVVTGIPRQRPMKRPDGTPVSSLADAMLDSPLSIFAESIRRIRVRIDLATRNLRQAEPQNRERGSVVMVTSTAPGEGKTTISLSLARAYALSGRTTLLIDCDLRKPSVHRHLTLHSSAGLVDYLASDAANPELASFTVEDPFSSVQVALGGRRSDIATDQLIANNTFSRLLEAAVTVFDIVILDTPPVGPVVDGIYLAQYADTIVFAVEARHTSQQDAKRALAAIATSKRKSAETLLVLNQHDDAKSAYYYKYKYYYDK